MARKLELELESPEKKSKVVLEIPFWNSLRPKKRFLILCQWFFRFPPARCQKKPGMARKLELRFKHGKKFTDAFEIPISNFLRLQTAKKSALNPSLKAFSFPHVLEAKTARNGQEWNKSWKDLDRS